MTGALIDVVLPVFNEAGSIEQTLRAIASAVSPIGPYRFIVAEDRGTDNTREIVQRLSHELPITLDSSDSRRGYSGAVRKALSLCKARYVLFVDSDGQYDPADIAVLWQRREDAAIVSGARARRADSRQRRLGSAVFGWMLRGVFPIPLRDPSSSFVLMQRVVVDALLPRMGSLPEAFWWEWNARAHQAGFTFVEVPVRHRQRVSGATQIYSPARLPGVVWRQARGLAHMWFRG